MGLLTRQSVSISGDVDPDTTEGADTLDAVSDALAMGLEAVAASIRDRFPTLGLTITLADQ